MRDNAFDRLIVGLGFACVAMLDTEAHSLLGLSVWRANRICDRVVLPKRRSCGRAVQAHDREGGVGRYHPAMRVER